jgi:hypothetical protein
VNTENENDPNAPKSHDPTDFKDNYGIPGAPSEGGEGQAILTRWNFTETRAVVVPCVRNKAMVTSLPSFHLLYQFFAAVIYSPIMPTERNTAQP